MPSARNPTESQPTNLRDMTGGMGQLLQCLLLLPFAIWNNCLPYDGSKTERSDNVAVCPYEPVPHPFLVV